MNSKPKTRMVEVAIRTPRAPGSDYAIHAVSMPSAECIQELNDLKRHLRGTPKSDPGERAEALACIMHIRARQLVLATQAAAIEHERDIRQTRYWQQRRDKYAKKNAIPQSDLIKSGDA